MRKVQGRGKVQLTSSESTKCKQGGNAIKFMLALPQPSNAITIDAAWNKKNPRDSKAASKESSAFKKPTLKSRLKFFLIVVAQALADKLM